MKNISEGIDAHDLFARTDGVSLGPLNVKKISQGLDGRIAFARKRSLDEHRGIWIIRCVIGGHVAVEPGSP